MNATDVDLSQGPLPRTTYGQLAGTPRTYVPIIETKRSTVMIRENRLNMNGSKLSPAAILVALDILAQHGSVEIIGLPDQKEPKIFRDWKDLLHADFQQ